MYGMYEGRLEISPTVIYKQTKILVTHFIFCQYFWTCIKY